MFFNNLHSAKLAQKSNLTYYEEAEDSDKVDNLGEKKNEKFGVFEEGKNAEFKAFCSLG